MSVSIPPTLELMEAFEKVDRLMKTGDQSLQMTFLQRVHWGDIWLGKDQMQELQEIGLLTPKANPTFPSSCDSHVAEYMKKKMGIEGFIPTPY